MLSIICTVPAVAGGVKTTEAVVSVSRKVLVTATPLTELPTVAMLAMASLKVTVSVRCAP